MSVFKRVALLRNPIVDPGDTLARLHRFLAGAGVTVLPEASCRGALDGVRFHTLEELQDVDLVIVIGGDGTLLHAARRFAPHGVPILGINLGRLGFLVDISPREMEKALRGVLDGDYVAETRFLLHAQVWRDDALLCEQLALNDVVVNNHFETRMIEFFTHIDGHYVNHERADGVVVATPTGSTAYALSAGGPILHPALEAITLVPICPHTLNHRPLVIDSSVEIAIGIDPACRVAAQASFDGQANVPLVAADRVVIRRSEENGPPAAPGRLRFLRHPPRQAALGQTARRRRAALIPSMLTQLLIRDFAIIDAAELEFGPGMTALTGETGAGKSILLDALGLVLGDRADPAALAEDAPRAEVSAVFDVGGLPAVRDWLRRHTLDRGELCILRRVVPREGASRAYINDSPVTVQRLRELGEQLVSIHGQHAHQALLHRDVQRRRLDDHGDTGALHERVAETYRAWREADAEHRRLLEAAQARDERLAWLRDMVGELDAVLAGGEDWDTLEEEHRRLAHAEALMQAAGEALRALYEDDDAVHDRLGRHAAALERVLAHDGRLAPAVEALGGALAQIEDAAETLRDYLADLNLDPERLRWVEARMGALHDLARKHRVEPRALPETAERLRRERDELERLSDALAEAAPRLARLRRDYLAAAAELSAARAAAAERLGTAVSEAMQTLGMRGGRFAVRVEPREHDPETGAGFSADGLDRVEFVVAANPGQRLQPLAKVASGGELSRISLAIQMITARSEPIPTLIFDEVDAGVGGAVAEVVGRQLRRLGEQRQVLCVTHLPQVAAQAHHHLRIRKEPAGRGVHTRVDTLDRAARVEEIARMLGGMTITATTREHAEEMLARAG
ncbi:MAG: hypothetical protein KatS3mg121_0026 [Gammaproteobacteria bacterium]|nr:MAG: hypothetical protein KatS3mg121_0026 [Gammaproteobacteria bacterium]